MQTASNFHRVILAVEGPDLEACARNFCTEFLPGSEIEMYPLEQFARSLELEPKRGEFRVIMLHADADGQLDSGSTLVRSLVNSRAPVLVVRHAQGSGPPNAQVKRVVVPLDGSAEAGQAIPIASHVALEKKVQVQFLMVIDPSRVIPPAYAYDPEARELIADLRETSHWALTQAEAAVKRDGVVSSSKLMFGPTNSSLEGNIVEGDLVVMASHKSHWQKDRDRESVTTRILVSTPQPIFVMQAQPQAPIVVDGYRALSWSELLQRDASRTE